LLSRLLVTAGQACVRSSSEFQGMRMVRAIVEEPADLEPVSLPDLIAALSDEEFGRLPPELVGSVAESVTADAGYELVSIDIVGSDDEASPETYQSIIAFGLVDGSVREVSVQAMDNGIYAAFEIPPLGTGRGADSLVPVHVWSYGPEFRQLEHHTLEGTVKSVSVPSDASMSDLEPDSPNPEPEPIPGGASFSARVTPIMADRRGVVRARRANLAFNQLYARQTTVVCDFFVLPPDFFGGPFGPILYGGVPTQCSAVAYVEGLVHVMRGTQEDVVCESLETEAISPGDPHVFTCLVPCHPSSSARYKTGLLATMIPPVIK
jgi:hypothetical protein